MSLLPVMVIFGLSFPPVFFELILSLALFFALHRLLLPIAHCPLPIAHCPLPSGIYDFVWHPTLFNTALYCCVFYLISCLFV